MTFAALVCILLTTFSLQASSVPLAPVNGPVSTGIAPSMVTYHPSGKFAAAPNWISNNVSIYRVHEKTGAFELIDTVATGNTPAFIAFSPNGKFAAVTNSDEGGPQDSIFIYKIDHKTGVWTPLQVTASQQSATPFGLAYSPDGKLLAVANLSGSTISLYRVAESGIITLCSQTSNLIGPNVPDFSPDGRFLAVTNRTGSSVSVYKVNEQTGTLSEITGEGSPYPVGSNPVGVTYQHDGKFIAIANYFSNTVTVYQVNKVTGALTQPQEIQSGNFFPFFVTFSNHEKFAAVGSNAVSGHATVFCVQDGIWSLSPTQILPTEISPRMLAFSPCQSFAALSIVQAVPGAAPGAIQIFEVDESACSDSSSSSTSSSTSWSYTE